MQRTSSEFVPSLDNVELYKLKPKSKVDSGRFIWNEFRTITGTYLYVLTSTNMYWHVLTRTNLSWQELTHTDTTWHVLTQPDTYWHALTHDVETETTERSEMNSYEV